MVAKKHKKESKKKKHRSRSRSPLDGDDRERKRHRKHKDRKKGRSADVEEVPSDSHGRPPAPRSHSRSKSAERERDKRSGERSYDPERDVDRDAAPTMAAGGGGGARDASGGAGGAFEGGGGAASMSVEETNKLRAKLGLKPLEVHEQPAEDGKLKDDLGEFYHKPAANLAEQRKADKLRERLHERKEKRALEQKLQGATLADGSDEEDAAAWVGKSRGLEKQKREAARRAALLDEMDAALGAGAPAAEEARAYTARQLRGLRVAHDIDALAEERETVLTLADKEVLAEDAEDVLVNVNIVDDERYKQNAVERKKAAAGYQAYDEEAELAAALGGARPVLAKYDAEIEPGAAQRERGFLLGDPGALRAARERDLQRQEWAAGSVQRRLESLARPAAQLAADYLTEHELNAKFKKFKKKGKMRKKAKAEPISVEDYDPSTAPLETDDTEVKPEHLAAGAGGEEEEEVEVDGELQAALARARRLRQAALTHSAIVPKVEEILERVKEEGMEAEAGGGAAEAAGEEGAMVLDATAEFCRTLGDIPTYGQAGNRDHAAEIMDFEQAAAEAEPEAEPSAGAWSRVDVNSDKPADLAAGSGAGLEAEPALGAGVAGALRLALSKGYLERAGAAPAPPARRTALPAAVYSIDDKTGGEDDKYGRRERGHGYAGPLTEFREKSHFRPTIKLEYVDDEGRALCPKEAFRYLSHKFHGKGPGKNKQEKRIKKQVQEGLMKKMSSTDTPLGTLHMLQQKQRDTHSAYVLLSGAKKEPSL